MKRFLFLCLGFVFLAGLSSKADPIFSVSKRGRALVIAFDRCKIDFLLEITSEVKECVVAGFWRVPGLNLAFPEWLEQESYILKGRLIIIRFKNFYSTNNAPKGLSGFEIALESHLENRFRRYGFSLSGSSIDYDKPVLGAIELLERRQDDSDLLHPVPVKYDFEPMAMLMYSMSSISFALSGTAEKDVLRVPFSLEQDTNDLVINVDLTQRLDAATKWNTDPIKIWMTQGKHDSVVEKLLGNCEHSVEDTNQYSRTIKKVEFTRSYRFANFFAGLEAKD